MNTNILQSIDKNIEQHTKNHDIMVNEFNKKYGFSSLEEEQQEEK